MAEVDLVVLGAGLAGSSLIARLRQLDWSGTIALVEAGRGPGGRMATRQRRDAPEWRLDHGAPGFNLSQPPSGDLDALLKPLRVQGVLQREWREVISLNGNGSIVANSGDSTPEGGWLRGRPCMADLCAAMLNLGDGPLERQFGTRVRWLERRDGAWCLMNEDRSWRLRGRRLVLSGTLLAHPRSLAMLGWREVPLREAVPEGMDPDLDLALETLARSRAEVRWNLMLDLPLDGTALPRQIWLTPDAQQQWHVERLVLQPQSNGHTGLVVHGLDDGEPITPNSQPALLQHHEQRLIALLPELLMALPELRKACQSACSLGLMRWGASRPLDHPLPQHLQWCSATALGFCGDFVAGAGFGRAEGALSSAVSLANTLVKG
ncbi:MAG: NAD(P)-binding protein [Cyanobacteriota bacterium]|nr:NAD(P)-binding protein [Cyanobacteriota bacterium]